VPEDPEQRAGFRPGGYRWPWFVLTAFILAIILAILWMSQEVRRTKRMRELNSSPSGPTSDDIKTRP
jgi:hypothetical protein